MRLKTPLSIIVRWQHQSCNLDQFVRIVRDNQNGNGISYVSPIIFTYSHLLTLKALPRQWVALETANLQSLRSRMLTSVSPFFLISLLMVSMYLNFGLPLGLTPSTSMSNTVLVIWLSSLRLTCPYQRMILPIGWPG